MTMTVELSWSGCRRQYRGGDPVVDYLLDGVQGGAWLGGLGWPGGEQGVPGRGRGLGAEDGEGGCGHPWRRPDVVPRCGP
jgi:hypothetical protein